MGPEPPQLVPRAHPDCSRILPGALPGCEEPNPRSMSHLSESDRCEIDRGFGPSRSRRLPATQARGVERFFVCSSLCSKGPCGDPFGRSGVEEALGRRYSANLESGNGAGLPRL